MPSTEQPKVIECSGDHCLHHQLAGLPSKI